jgi:signal transduction histidine kinase
VKQLLDIKENLEAIQLGYDVDAYVSTNTADDLIHYCKDLINLAEQQQQEFATLSESIAEDDAMIQQLRQENETLRLELKILKCKKWYPVYEENLRMAQELDRLKKAPYDGPCD